MGINEMIAAIAHDAINSALEAMADEMEGNDNG